MSPMHDWQLWGGHLHRSKSLGGCLQCRIVTKLQEALFSLINLSRCSEAAGMDATDDKAVYRWGAYEND